MSIEFTSLNPESNIPNNLRQTKKYWDIPNDHIYFVSLDIEGNVIVTLFENGEKFQAVAPSHPTTLSEIIALNLF